MFPLIRFVAVFGGVAAGCQVASGCVRAVKALCHGRPVQALVEVADGLAAPILTACTEVSKFGKEVYDAVASPWMEHEMPKEQADAEQPKVCCQKLHAEEDAAANGVLSLAAKS